MKTREITEADFKSFAQHMTALYGATLIHKQDAIEMQWLAKGFDVARMLGAQVPSSNDFLEHTATTIGTLIYMPDGWSPEERVIVLAHECAHVAQFTRGMGRLSGGPGMWWLYLVEPEARVTYEADAYASDLTVQYALNGVLSDLDSLMMPLEGGYMLGQKERDLGRALIEQAATSVVNGAGNFSAGNAAVEWLRVRGLVT